MSKKIPSPAYAVRGATGDSSEAVADGYFGPDRVALSGSAANFGGLVAHDVSELCAVRKAIGDPQPGLTNHIIQITRVERVGAVAELPLEKRVVGAQSHLGSGPHVKLATSICAGRRQRRRLCEVVDALRGEGPPR